MKKSVALETCKKILDDHQHSGTWLENQLDQVEDLVNNSKTVFQNMSFKKTCTICKPFRGCSCCQRFCGFCRNPRSVTCDLCSCCSRSEESSFNIFAMARRFALLAATYLDLTKDVTLLMTMVQIIQISLFNQISTFSSTITWILIVSIFPPLLFSAIETAKNRPTTILGGSVWQSFEEDPPNKGKRWALQVFIIVFYPVVPAILICVREEAKVKKKELFKETRREWNQNGGMVHTKAIERLEHVEKYLCEVRKGILAFKLNELSLEVPLQLGLQTIMLLLGTSISVTHSGMQALFQQEFQASINLLEERFLSVSMLGKSGSGILPSRK